MGVTRTRTETSGQQSQDGPPPAVPRLDRWRWLPNASPATVKRLAIATLVANIALVVTGGAVRLTGSGLGCPTWPRCTSSSFVAHEALGVNGYIEFGNRMLTIVLTLISFVNWAAVMRLRSPRRDLRTLASVLLLAIPVQAVVGGISVLTKLNPWVVSCHLLASLAVIGLAVLLVCRIGEHPGPTRRVVPGPIALLSQLVFGVTCAVLYVGTVVTGSGPHAGSKEAPRNGLDPAAVSQLHADLVCILVGLTVGLVVALRAFRSAERIRRAARWLLGLELAQGIVGFTQYFTGLPIVLVGLHMLGAALISAAVTWVLLGMREPLVTPRVAPSSDV